MVTVECQHCGTRFETQRRTRKFCTQSCANRSAWVVAKTRSCRHCQADFVVTGVRDANRQHCSRECAKNHNSKAIRAWVAEHPEATKKYRANQLAKDPDYERKRWWDRRGRIIEMLGGQCVVCGASNPHWLHVDFIPTSRGIRYRHPRHYKYVSQNKHLFRILCANHHYELTLTGRIEGSDITQ
jgi:hypothetical protein